jgi:NAD(P)-dependent dehydrogenase (short-subunit alcohol dehydrogenase family)/rhamnose utilization protein RhaD (predicted bifunctional aldolase and dehydrogenase)
MDQSLRELIDISVKTGSDSTLVQGGGGNTSAKTADGKYMYIKASGTALKDMSGKRGWRRLDMQAVLDIVNDERLSKVEPGRRESEVVSRLLLSCRDEFGEGSRPSVEAHLHALLKRYVIHLHPNAVGAYVNCTEGRERIDNLFADEKYPPLWVPYVDPGLLLAVKIRRLMDKYEQEHGRGAEVLILQKHGLFVTADKAGRAVQLVRKVLRKCMSKLREPAAGRVKRLNVDEVNDIKLAVRRAVFAATGERQVIKYFDDDIVMGFIRRKNAGKMLGDKSLTPDELIYSGGPAVWVDRRDSELIERKILARISKTGKAPSAFAVKGAGLFTASSEKIAGTLRDIVCSSMFIRYNADRMGRIATLNKRQSDFINNWESEAFRKKLAGGAGGGAEVAGKVAVVTGAGSGLGRSIAVGLAKEGALVALADIDTAAAGDTADMINEQGSGGAAMVAGCDVTNEESVSSAIWGIVERWGGLDVVVNAAGVAPAYAVEDTPVDKWRFALEVNLTGYMLMVKYAARVMKAQGMGGSIVNISSKSGIQASKNNSAYNATKAGELHLTRGWAMELGRDGIRVNAVCPGNVFEGSKIWNPKYIEVCARKYGIRPDEVIPYYVSKTMLNLEIKGQDIADAVVFLASERARRITAQTLVVDAGQAPVR